MAAIGEKLRPTYLPDEAEFVASTTIHELTGASFEEPDGIRYLNAPLHVYITQENEGVRTDVVVDHSPIDGTGLLEFLGVVSPIGKDATLIGVKNDWDVVDRAVDGDRYATKLVSDHSSGALLHQAWADFMRSRPAFLGAVETAFGPDYINFRQAITGYPIVVTDEKLPQFTAQAAIEYLGSEPLALCTQALERLGINSPYKFLLGKVADLVNRRRHPDRQIKNADRLIGEFNKWSPENQKRWLRSVIDGLGPELAGIVYKEFGGPLFDSFQYEDETYHYRVVDEAEAGQSGKRRRISAGPWSVEVVETGSGFSSKRRAIPGTLRRLSYPTELMPLIAWVNDAEQKSFIQAQYESSKEEHFRTADSTLGVLAVAYFSPEIRAGWPKQLRLAKGGPYQRMGVVQMPVYALMRRERLLRSDFVKSVDELVRTG